MTIEIKKYERPVSSPNIHRDFPLRVIVFKHKCAACGEPKENWLEDYTAVSCDLAKEEDCPFEWCKLEGSVAHGWSRR